MSALGRGRGILPRSAAPPNDGKRFPNSRLGSSSHGPNSSSNGFGSKFSRADLNGPPDLDSYKEKLLTMTEDDSLFPSIIDIVNCPNTTQEIVKKMVEITIDQCMWLPTISKKYAALLNFLVSHKIFGENIRRTTLDVIQEFFENRENFCASKKYGENTLSNAVILLGEISYRYRLNNNRIKVLSEALITYLIMLTSSVHDDDLLVMVQQMSWSGEEIANSHKSSINKLMVTIRTNLVVQSASYTDFGKLCLLLCLDLQHYQYEQLPDDLVEFYKTNLGERTFNSIKPPSLEVDNHVKYYNSIRKFFTS